MNPSHRESWPPPSVSGHMNMHRANEQNPRSSGQPALYGSNTPSHPPPQSSGPVLPPPPGPFYSAPGSNMQGLPAISSMGQSSSNAGHRPSLQPQDQPMTSQAHSGPPQGAAYSLPGINQPGPGQPLPPHQAFDRDREMQEARERDIREREYEQQARREREARDREMRDRQQREQGPPHQNHAEQLQLHQPVAVGPRTAIHGPNGLLANTGPPSNPNPPAAPNGHMTLFGPHFDSAPRGVIQQSGQLPPQSMMPFGGTPNMHQMPVPALVHGQQPILNDALSYLDQVKVQFADQPNVYNQFLDIMKDFKSQAIDTPGVIRRVSSLFAGNPNLIQGFNTFLPPGYRIECGTADDPNAIRVTTPMGTTVSPMGSTLRPLSNPRPIANDLTATGPQMYETSGRGADGAWLQQGPDQADGMLSPTRSQAQSLFAHQLGTNQARMSPFDAASHREQQGLGLNAALLAHQQEQRGVSQLQNAASVAAGDTIARQNGPGHSPPPEMTSPVANGSGMTPQQGGQGGEKRGPVEFNHAISYVNKIKNRYSGQPEIYKQFLEILQTYQRESKPIQDVYAQVTQLFNDAPDLLQDFKQFLPESAAHAKAVAAKQAAEDMTQLSNLRGDPAYANQVPQQHQTPRPEQHRLPPVGNFAPTPSATRDVKRKRGDRQSTVVGPSMNASGPSADVGGAAGSNPRPGFAPNKRTKQTQQQQQGVKTVSVVPEGPTVSPTLVPELPVPMSPKTSTAATPDELAFFDRVKKYVGNKNTMNEFLKLCNLYSQDLIDKNSLVYRVQNFIGGNPDLFSWFKTFVDYDGKDQIIENRAKPSSGRVVLNNCRAYGPSYRLLPKRERLKKCSGRDDLCHRVLNDDWASHPTWASEDSGFIAHRKNQYEEHLHRIEEERHDYDHYLAVLERSIQILAPLVHQKQMMPEADESRWKLHRDFAGQSQSILRRALAKIYQRDQYMGVMTGMIERPGVVVPIVLTRFKQKLEEWKASHREWEKVWRDATQKFFWRSLDHQGINAKMADKRQFQTKTLQNEIHVKHEEQKRNRLILHNVQPHYQAEYSFVDIEVLIDASRLLLTYAEHTHSTDFPKLTTFIKDFVPLFFGLEIDGFQQRIRDIFENSTPTEDVDEDTPTLEDSSSSRGRKTNGKRLDLLRDVLGKGRNGRSGRGEKEGSAASGSRASTPDVASVADEEMPDASADGADEEVKPKIWLDHPVEGNSLRTRDIKPNEPFKRNTFNLYANLPIYCFFRMFVILYERLNHLKMNERDVHDAVRRAKALKAAIDLKMIDKSPDNFFADTTPSANYYSQMLTMLEDFLKGDGRMDMPHIEEVLRRFYLQSGWMLYSFDKMLSALVRFAIAILNNDPKEKSQEILQLFQKDRRKDMTTHQDELAYRKQVEKYVKDGDVYRIAYNQITFTATIRILKKDETTFDASGAADDEAVLTPEQRWTYYISSYTSLEPTEGIPLTRLSPMLRRRNLRAALKSSRAGSTTASSNLLPNLTLGLLGTEEDGGAADAHDRRMDRLRSREVLGLRISPVNYHIYWSVVGSEEWWVASPEPEAGAGGKPVEVAVGVASGGMEGAEGGVEAAKAEEGGAGAGGAEEEGGQQDEGASVFEERFVMNNRWMAGLSKDDVDAKNKGYREWKGKGRALEVGVAAAA